MRIAVLSDIHGNLTALEAVIADLRSTSPDPVVHAGDLVANGSSQRAVPLQPDSGARVRSLRGSGQPIRGRIHPNDRSSADGSHVAASLPACPAYADVSEKIVSRKPLGSLTSNARLFHSVS
jgi:3',5'-cyclic AMP phosphodiesterase CpdA